MILCLDVGNSHIYGGVFDNDTLILQFRYPTTAVSTSDQLGIFFRQVLQENNINISNITEISVGSVVPSIDYSVRAAAIKYFNKDPFFLKAGVKTGLKISYKNPLEVGADRIACAIAATNQFPQKNLVIVDFGTATTFDVVRSDNNYLGGVIMPGIKISMSALNENTAKLPPVNILKPDTIIGQTTIANIQAGLYFGHLGAVNKIIDKISEEAFDHKKPLIIGTGGFSSLFESENIFTAIIPELVLHGLRLAHAKQ
ncbi:MAG: type III pantothenate kinase [Gammaproteobacteria bacterium]|nr:type III pantothenate kinase [Gammaproteobacteria bacterium]